MSWGNSGGERPHHSGEGNALIGRDEHPEPLLNTLIATGLFLAFVLVGAEVFGYWRGYVGSLREAIGVGLFPFALLFLSALCWAIARSGHVEVAAHTYVWGTFVLAVIVAVLFGYQSPAWLLVIWPVALAGGLLSPIGAPIAGGVAFVVFGAVLGVQRAGWYVPPLSMSIRGSVFSSLIFGWLMTVIAVGFVSYFVGRNVRRLMTHLRRTSKKLEETQRDLQRQIAQQTSTLQNRAEQFRAIAEVGQLVVSMQELDGLLRTTVDSISQRLGFYHVGIFLIDVDGEWAVLHAASSEGGQKMLARGHRLRVGQQGIVGHVADTGEPRIAFDVGADAVWFNNPDLPETKSEMALPLVSAGRVIGVLDIQSREAAAFDAEDIETLRVLAGSVTIAIENARLLEEMREALRRAERYQEQDALRAWRQALARRRMQVAYAYRDGVVASLPIGEDKGLDLSPDAVEGVMRHTTGDGRHFLLAPISVSGQRLGVLAFERTWPWSDEAVRLVEAVVSQLDLALDNARLLEETRLRASQEAARSAIVSRIHAFASTEAILRSAAEELGKALHVERSRIQLARFES